MRVSVLFDYDASSLLCSSLTIFYTTMFRFDSRFEDERCFLCIRDARDCNVENYVLLLNDCHSLSREIFDERETRTMKR